MAQNRQTEAVVSVESRIQSGATHFFELDKQGEAYDKARELKSYVYPCYDYVERGKTKTLEMVGYCVPV